MRTLFFQNAATGPEPDSIVPAHGQKCFVEHPDAMFTPRGVRLIARAHGRSMQSKGIHGEVMPLKMTLVLPSERLDATENGYENIPLLTSEIRHVRQLTPAEIITVRVDNPTDTPWDARVVLLGEGSIGQSHVEETVLGLRPQRDASGTRRLRVAARGSLSSTLQFPWMCTPRRLTMRSDSQLDVVVAAVQVANVSLFMGAPIPVEVFDGGLEFRTINVTPANRMTVSLFNSGDTDRYVEIDVDVDVPHVRSATDLRAAAAQRVGEPRHGGPQGPH